MTAKSNQRCAARRRNGFGAAAGGAVAAEFALIAAPLLLLLAGLVELGFVLHAEAGLQYATSEAGRLIRTGQVTTRTGALVMDASTFIDTICARVPALSNCVGSVSIDVQSASSFKSLSSSMRAPVDVGPSSPGGSPTINFAPGGSSKPTSVIVTYDWTFGLPIMRPFGNVFSGSARRLEAVAVFRNEPF